MGAAAAGAALGGCATASAGGASADPARVTARAAAGAHSLAPVPGRRFDGRRAYALAVAQVRKGPRPAGSAAQREMAALLRPMLPGGHFESVPGGLRNVVGEIPGRGPAIVVAAHYDTTPVPGYLGANNSATGVGAVVELARDMRHDRAPPGAPPVVFALFDGEEAPAGFTDFLAQGLRGSRAYAAAHAGATREVIVLDFIALLNERLPREQGSDPQLWGLLRSAAARVGAGRLFPDATASLVYDDHTSFTQVGIPAIDLIDFDYACWQKLCDDLRQVSERNLAAVGESVLELLRSERRRFATG